MKELTLNALGGQKGDLRGGGECPRGKKVPCKKKKTLRKGTRVSVGRVIR